jgi:alkylation response protein AidB-like acyl-CoA dehydrogenase
MQLDNQMHEAGEREERLRMIEESAEAVLHADRARARGLRYSQPGFERSKWKEFAELGWLAMLVSEDDGGLGMGMAELCVIARHMGRELTPEPLLTAAVIAPLLPADLREQAILGERIVLPAFAAFAPSLRSDVIGATHEPVVLGQGADAYLIAVNEGACVIERDGLSVPMLHATHDGGHLVDVRTVPEHGSWLDMDLAPAREKATLALSAYLLGVSETAFQLTLEYLKDRKQFDKPIGAFQALQHRMVDLYLEKLLLEAAVAAAAAAFDHGENARVCANLLSLAKARAGKASSVITRSAIQLHGGIGYADEADIGLYVRKSMTLAGLLGTERFHRDRAFMLSGGKA